MILFYLSRSWMEEKRRSSCKVFCRQVLVAVCNGSMFALSNVWILAGQQQEYGKRWRGMTYAVDLTWLIQSHLYWISFFLLLLLCTSQSLVDVTDLSFIYYKDSCLLKETGGLPNIKDFCCEWGEKREESVTVNQ